MDKSITQLNLIIKQINDSNKDRGKIDISLYSSELLELGTLTHHKAFLMQINGESQDKCVALYSLSQHILDIVTNGNKKLIKELINNFNSVLMETHQSQQE